jgi:hypothetical protein
MAYITTAVSVSCEMSPVLQPAVALRFLLMVQHKVILYYFSNKLTCHKWTLALHNEL